jgi:hypothetical protein
VISIGSGDVILDLRGSAGAKRLSKPSSLHNQRFRGRESRAGGHAEAACTRPDHG